MDRRTFLKSLGATAAATSLTACGADKANELNNSNDKNQHERLMTYRNAPNGDRTSILGYGCMRLPKLKSPAENGNVCDQEAVNVLVDHAIKLGVNFFDTSPGYMQGWSERTIGEALKRYPREKLYYSTKLSNFDPSTWTREGAMKIYQNSFKYLQTDYIDYYFLHAIGGGGKKSMETLNARYFDNGMFDFLIEERAKGKIRNLGFSFHGDVRVYDHMLALHDEGKVKWDFVMIQLNYLDWHYADKINTENVRAEYLYAELDKRNIHVMIMEPLLGGRLANIPDYLREQLIKREPNRSIASWAFRYAASRSRVYTVLSGMTYMEHLKDNISTYSPFKPLNEEEMRLLDRDIAEKIMEYKSIPCTDCKYCMPCPYGIDIPTILQHYNKCIFEDNIVPNENSAEYNRARRAFLIGYDRSAPRLRQASHCTGCGKCIPHCPQGIDIVAELHRIDAYVEWLKQNK